MKTVQPSAKAERGTSVRLPGAEDEVSSALLNAARRIFEVDGLPALSVRRVAEAAGCTTMQVYSRFGGKGGLLEALFNEGFDTLANAQKAVSLSLHPAERVCQLCSEYLRIASERPHHYALMLGAHSGEFEPPKESQERALATLLYLVNAVGAALPPSNDREQRATEVAHQILAFCHGWAMLSASGLVGGSPVVVRNAIMALLR